MGDFLATAARSAAGNVEQWMARDLLALDPPRRSVPPFLAGKGQGCGVIAEIKRKSPSRGDLMGAAEPLELLDAYASAGAEAVSVVVEEQHFGGSPELFAGVAGGCDLPLLWKDFVIDPYQIRLAAHLGASAVLLIAGLRKGRDLAGLIGLSCDLGLRPLVEVHGGEELDAALEAGADLVGVNNRDLVTLEVDLSLSEQLAPRLKGDVQGVAESGMRDPDDVRRMAELGYRAVLVGTTLVTSDEPAEAVEAMVRAGRRP